MKILVIDPKIAGISGDMFLSSIIDLTESEDLLMPLEDAINNLENCKKFKFYVKDVDVGIRAKRLEIELKRLD